MYGIFEMDSICSIYMVLVRLSKQVCTWLPYARYFLRWTQLQHIGVGAITQTIVGKYRVFGIFWDRHNSQSEYTACMVLAEFKHKLKCTVCTAFFPRWTQSAVRICTGVGAIIQTIMAMYRMFGIFLWDGHNSNILVHKKNVRKYRMYGILWTCTVCSVFFFEVDTIAAYSCTKKCGKIPYIRYFLRGTSSQSEYTACMVLAELKHKLKYTGCTVFFSRWAQFEVYGVGAFLDRHNLQHMVLVQNRHADWIQF